MVIPLILGSMAKSILDQGAWYFTLHYNKKQKKHACGYLEQWTDALAEVSGRSKKQCAIAIGFAPTAHLFHPSRKRIDSFIRVGVQQRNNDLACHYVYSVWDLAIFFLG